MGNPFSELDDTFNVEETVVEDKLCVYEEKFNKLKLQFEDIEKDISERMVDEDFAQSRATLEYLLQSGREVLEAARQNTVTNPNPRNIETFFTAIKMMADVNKELLDIHTKLFGVKAMTGDTSSNKTTIENQQINIFNGTLNDLLNVVENKEKIIEAEIKDE